MFDRFDEAGRRVVSAAVASGTPTDAEELLIALLHEPGGDLEDVLRRLSIDGDCLADDVARISGWKGPSSLPGSPLLTRRALGVLGAAVAEARAMRHAKAGPGHILLGLLRVTDGATANVLGRANLSMTHLRKLVRGLSTTEVSTALPRQLDPETAA